MLESSQFTIDRSIFKDIPYRVTALAFEFTVTCLWFTILPLGAASERLRSRYPDDSAFNHQISIYQYYFLPIVSLCKYVISIGIAFAINFFTHSLIYASISSAIAYLALSGGIHLDGLIDTIDALYAYGKDRYSVMREPHVGAIGVAWLILYVLLFVTNFAQAVHYILGLQNPLPLLIIFSIPFMASQINCYGILQYAMSRSILKQDASMSLAPQYSFSRRLVTDQKPFSAMYLISFILLNVSEYWLDPDSVVFLVGFASLSALFTILFNRLITHRIARELTFINGDVFGATICSVELLIVGLFNIIFVGSL